MYKKYNSRDPFSKIDLRGFKIDLGDFKNLQGLANPQSKNFNLLASLRM
ncbi:MAG: hypothetical protein ACI86M_000844 [Saprospiraceae bacterium]